MTLRSYFGKNSFYKAAFSSAICLTVSILMLLFGAELKKGVTYGLELSVQNLIPTLFPFFILSELWSKTFSVKDDGLLGKCFERLFKVNSSALTAFLSGIICGFPLGVKTAVDLYDSDNINKDELLHLCGFINNPSIAFVVFGVGAGLYNSVKYGIELYLCVVLSAIIIGLIFRGKEKKICKSNDNSGQSFNLVKSIKNAGLLCIAVSSYVIFFSSLLFLIRALAHSDILISIISPLFEVSTATRIIADNQGGLCGSASMLTAFALGFSGFSVHLQTFAIMPPEISRSKYIIMKLLQGLLTSILIIPLSHI